MKTIMRLLAVIVMMTMVVPAFPQGIWNNDGFPSGFGSESTSGEIFEEDSDNGYALGEEKSPIHDCWEVVAIASLLYGIFFVRRQKRRDAACNVSA